MRFKGKAVSLTDHDRLDWRSAKHRPRFAYQCIVTFEVYQYAEFDQKIPLGLRVMNNFIKTSKDMVVTRKYKNHLSFLAHLSRRLSVS